MIFFSLLLASLWSVIGASLSGEISVRMFACLLVSVGLRARIAGQNFHVSIAEQLPTPSQQVTGLIPGNDMHGLFFSLLFLHAMYAHARRLPAYFAYCMN